METIKRILAIVLVMFALCSMAQYSDSEIEAFAESHELEYKGEYTNAINVLRKVYNEDNYEINLRLGWLNYMSGLFSESVPYYQKCIKLKPLSIEALLGIINPTAAMGNWTQVENSYNEILKLDPENSTALYRLGSIYYGKEDYGTASKYFERLLNHYPFDYDSMIMSAWTYYRLGEMRKAKVLFKKVLLNSANDKSAIEGLELIDG
jgi:tetratricopeptide (TPR) repeat protein